MPQQNTFTINCYTFSLPPQTATILRHLKRVGDISGVEAQAMYKARSLTKRMSEINEALFFKGGVDQDGPDPIIGQWSRDNTGQRYKRYVMPARLRHALSFA